MMMRMVEVAGMDTKWETSNVRLAIGDSTDAALAWTRVI